MPSLDISEVEHVLDELKKALKDMFCLHYLNFTGCNVNLESLNKLAKHYIVQDNTEVAETKKARIDNRAEKVKSLNDKIARIFNQGLKEDSSESYHKSIIAFENLFKEPSTNPEDNESQYICAKSCLQEWNFFQEKRLPAQKNDKVFPLLADRIKWYLPALRKMDLSGCTGLTWYAMLALGKIQRITYLNLNLRSSSLPNVSMITAADIHISSELESVHAINSFMPLLMNVADKVGNDHLLKKETMTSLMTNVTAKLCEGRVDKYFINYCNEFIVNNINHDKDKILATTSVEKSANAATSTSYNEASEGGVESVNTSQSKSSSSPKLSSSKAQITPLLPVPEKTKVVPAHSFLAINRENDQEIKKAGQFVDELIRTILQKDFLAQNSHRADQYIQVMTALSSAIKYLKVLPFTKFEQLIRACNKALSAYSHEVISFKICGGTSTSLSLDLVLILAADYLNDEHINKILRLLTKNAPNLAGVSIVGAKITGKGLKGILEKTLNKNNELKAIKIKWRRLQLKDIPSIDIAEVEQALEEIKGELKDLCCLQHLDFTGCNLSRDSLEKLAENYIVQDNPKNEEGRGTSFNNLPDKLDQLKDKIDTIFNQEAANDSLGSYDQSIAALEKLFKNPNAEEAKYICAKSCLQEWRFFKNKRLPAQKSDELFRKFATRINWYFPSLRAIDLSGCRGLTWHAISELGKIQRITDLNLQLGSTNITTAAKITTSAKSDSTKAIGSFMPLLMNLADQVGKQHLAISSEITSLMITISAKLNRGRKDVYKVNYGDTILTHQTQEPLLVEDDEDEISIRSSRDSSIIANESGSLNHSAAM